MHVLFTTSKWGRHVYYNDHCTQFAKQLNTKDLEKLETNRKNQNWFGMQASVSRPEINFRQ